MNYFDAIILGIVEGLTEFLPVSSTGHLILTSSVLGISGEFLKSFEIIIQLGAILSVVYLYHKTLLRNPELLKKVAVAFLPTAIIGLAVYKTVKIYLFGNNLVVVLALFLGGVVIIAFEYFDSRRTKKLDEESPQKISYKESLLIGLFQSIAIIPGVSRSAATIIGGRILGISKVSIVEFSFLLAIPTMLAASALDIFKNYNVIMDGNFGLLLVGFVVSFITALFAVKGFLKFIQTKSFAMFGWYRIIIAIIAFFFLI